MQRSISKHWDSKMAQPVKALATKSENLNYSWILHGERKEPSCPLNTTRANSIYACMCTYTQINKYKQTNVLKSF